MGLAEGKCCRIHPPSVEKGFVKEEALCLLRTNSVKESFESKKLQFLTRLLERGYPKTFVEDILSEQEFLHFNLTTKELHTVRAEWQRYNKTFSQPRSVSLLFISIHLYSFIEKRNEAF